MCHNTGGTLEAPDVGVVFWCLWLRVAVQSDYRESSCSGDLWRCCTGCDLHTSHQDAQAGNATPNKCNKTHAKVRVIYQIYIFISIDIEDFFVFLLWWYMIQEYCLRNQQDALLHLWPGSCWVPCSSQVEAGMAQAGQTRVLLKKPSSLGWRRSLLPQTLLYWIMKCSIALHSIVIYKQCWLI